MIDAGTYRARATTWGLGETSTGKEQVAVDFVLLDADGVEGPHITWFGFFTDKSWERTVESLRHCGWTGTDLSELEGLDANEVELVIEHEQYEGKTTARVQWVNAPGGAMALKAPLTPEKAKAFAARMKGNIIAMQKKGPTPRAKPRTGVLSPEPPPHGDSDLPF